MRRNRYFASAAVVVVLAGCGEAAQSPLAPADDVQFNQSHGLVRTTWPSAEDPGMPFYARIEIGQIVTVDGWAIIAFYRDPACIPADFNLLTFFDAPAAFGCPHTVEGFTLWYGEAFAGAPPATSMVEVSALIDRRMLVEVEAVAYRPGVGEGDG